MNNFDLCKTSLTFLFIGLLNLYYGFKTFFLLYTITSLFSFIHWYFNRKYTYIKKIDSFFAKYTALVIFYNIFLLNNFSIKFLFSIIGLLLSYFYFNSQKKRKDYDLSYYNSHFCFHIIAIIIMILLLISKNKNL